MVSREGAATRAKLYEGTRQDCGSSTRTRGVYPHNTNKKTKNKYIALTEQTVFFYLIPVGQRNTNNIEELNHIKKFDWVLGSNDNRKVAKLVESPGLE